MNTVKISVRIPEAEFNALGHIAASRLDTISDVIREAIYLYIEDNVDTGRLYRDEKTGRLYIK